MTEHKRVTIIGSGEFATAISRIIARNVLKLDNFCDDVIMFVHEKFVEGQYLTDIINETHENVKYLPGHILPENIIAIPDLVESAKDADILIFIFPQQYLVSACKELQGKIKPTASGLSLIKGFGLTNDGLLELNTHIITKILKIQVSVLMGAILADELANEKFCEATIGCQDKNLSLLFKDLIQTHHLRVILVEDAEVVEICGGLRNVIASGVGFVAGLGLGRNAKAAVLRVGMLETIKFVDTFCPGGRLSTFFESCGVGDLLTTYRSTHHRVIAEEFIRTGKSTVELETEICRGNQLDGLITAEKVSWIICNRDLQDSFPFLTCIHKIYAGELEPQSLLDALKGHTGHINVRLKHLTW